MPAALASFTARAAALLRNRVYGGPSWIAGAIAGAQALAFGFALVSALVLSAVAPAPLPPGQLGVDWDGAMRFAGQFWLLAHGMPAGTAAATYTLAPLGLTALLIVLIASLVRRFCAASWASRAAACVAYGGGAALVSLGVSAPGASVLRAGVSAAAVAGIGAVLGSIGVLRLRPRRTLRVPAYVTAGARMGAGIAVGALAIGAVIAVMWGVSGAQRVADTASGLGADPLGGAVLAIGETTYGPTVALWGLAWGSGVGFSLGEGSLYAPSLLVPAPLPAVPLLGVVPDASGGPLVWLPLIFVLWGALARVVMRGHLPDGLAGVAAHAVALAVTVLGVGALAQLAAGAIGPGRLASVGPRVADVASVVGGLTATGAALAALVLWGGHRLVGALGFTGRRVASRDAGATGD